MSSPEGRRFVGSIDKIDPERVYSRERAESSSGIPGLSADYVNKTRGPFNSLFVFRNQDLSLEERQKALAETLDAVLGIPTYTEHVQTYRAKHHEHYMALLAEDVLPYTETIDEIVAEMKTHAQRIKDYSQENGISAETEQSLNSLLKILDNFSQLINQIIHSETRRADAKYVFDKTHNSRSAEPMVTNLDTLKYVTAEQMKKNLENEESVMKESPEKTKEEIEKRLQHVKELLRQKPLEGSLSILHNDGNVTPIDWAPTETEREKLKKSGDGKTP